MSCYKLLNACISNFIKNYVARNSSACIQEVDKDWDIAWPTTNSGDMARQKCPGGAGINYEISMYVHFVNL